MLKMNVNDSEGDKAENLNNFSKSMNFVKIYDEFCLTLNVQKTSRSI